MTVLLQLVLWTILANTLVFALPEDIKRHRKAIGIFNVVKFPNAPCIGSGNNNGTCFTSEECATRNGVSSGSCADGFGVCCVITLECGGTTTDNCTYIVQSSSNNPSVDPVGSEVCDYTICPISSSISRIRFDLATFNIAGPIPVQGVNDGDADAATQTSGRAVGHCVTDSFTVSGAPTICGVNTGQHMIIDSDGTECVSATFVFGGNANTREYNIHITQFESSNSVELAGPAGCLQYRTGITGIVNSFNWQGVGTAAGPASTHLANQDYTVCVRQAAGYCYICWTPTGISAAAGNILGTFGVSNGESDAAAPKSGAGVDCPMAVNDLTDSVDYVIIPGGAMTAADFNNIVANTAAPVADKYCGRYLSDDAAGMVGDENICSRRTPFILGVHFDGFEAAAAAGNNMADMNEAADGGGNDAYAMGPLGTIGFSLTYTMRAC